MGAAVSGYSNQTSFPGQPPVVAPGGRAVGAARTMVEKPSRLGGGEVYSNTEQPKPKKRIRKLPAKPTRPQRTGINDTENPTNPFRKSSESTDPSKRKRNPLNSMLGKE